jgi:hypothetical protein
MRGQNIYLEDIFCDVTPCSLVDVLDVSEERAVSFFRQTSKPGVEKVVVT